MVLRFFMLQAHYRSTINFSDQALQHIHYPTSPAECDVKINEHLKALCKACYTAICYDFNTARVIGHLFDLAKYINAVHTQDVALTHIEKTVWQEVKKVYTDFVQDVLGLGIPPQVDGIRLVEQLLELYQQTKVKKDYKQVDSLRLLLKKQGIVVQDGKSGVSWRYGY